MVISLTTRPLTKAGFGLLLAAGFLLAPGSQPAKASVCEDDVICQIYVNLTAVNPSVKELNGYKNFFQEQVDKGLKKREAYEAVARKIATESAEFQTVTLNVFAQPWSQKDGELGTPLNDTTLTIIKAVTEEIDFRRIMFDDLIAKAVGTPSGVDSLVLADGTVIPQYYTRSNDHYKALQNQEKYHLPGFVKLQSQAPLTHKNPNAISGILSTNGFGIAAFLAGTNRRSIPMLLREATCLDIEEIRDATAPETYILRDVGRVGAGGSITDFKTRCKTCHGFMDQVAPAFIYYNISGGEVSGNAVVFDEPSDVTKSVPPNNKMMNVVSQTGWIPKNDEWRAEFSAAQKALLGWPKERSHGFGSQTLGEAWANTEAFAKCQPKKAYKAVCGKFPGSKDAAFTDVMVKEFKENGYKLQPVFLKSAVYCAGGYAQ